MTIWQICVIGRLVPDVTGKTTKMRGGYYYCCYCKESLHLNQGTTEKRTDGARHGGTLLKSQPLEDRGRRTVQPGLHSESRSSLGYTAIPYISQSRREGGEERKKNG